MFNPKLTWKFNSIKFSNTREITVYFNIPDSDETLNHGTYSGK